jgi:hypothetical protein
MINILNLFPEECLVKSRIIKNRDEIFIWVPAKLPKTLNHLEIDDIKNINNNSLAAKELILLFLSYIAKTQFLKEEKRVGKKEYAHLHSKLLSKYLRPLGLDDSAQNNLYDKIINTCIKGTDKGSFITVNDSYLPGCYSKSYTYNDPYYGIQMVKYKIKTEYVKDIIIRNYNEALVLNQDNIIVKNNLELYKNLEIPTKDKLLTKAKELIAKQYKTKKGKTLMFRHNNSNSRFKHLDLSTISFVEDNIRQFEFLISPSFLMPMVGGIESGGRVCDSLTLLPSWIRSEITINGVKLIEHDYKCLHPNILVSLYEGNQQYITHKKIVNSLNLNDNELQRIKTEHLSFFNKRIEGMEKMSDLYLYYSKYEAEMLNKIKEDKIINKHTYTSKLMFAKEVEIMSDCISQLNALDIQVMYIYDALACEEKDSALVEQIMNDTIIKHGVFTATYDKNITNQIESDNNKIMNTLEDALNPPETKQEQKQEPIKHTEIVSLAPSSLSAASESSPSINTVETDSNTVKAEITQNDIFDYLIDAETNKLTDDDLRVSLQPSGDSIIIPKQKNDNELNIDKIQEIIDKSLDIKKLLETIINNNKNDLNKLKTIAKRLTIVKSNSINNSEKYKIIRAITIKLDGMIYKLNNPNTKTIKY